MYNLGKKKGGGEFYIKMWKGEGIGKQFTEEETREQNG